MALRVLDLFCGGGGSSWGAYKAGAEVACGVDAWDIAVSVYNDNFQGRGVQAYISADSNPRDVSQYGPFDMILASPECTHHTCARGNRPRDESSKLTAKHVLNYLRFYRPRWAVIENVVHMKKWERYEELLSELRILGYNISPQTLNACDFGVPQSRNRLFILCDREAKVEAVVPAECSEFMPTVRSILDPVGTWRRSMLYAPRRAAATIERAERALAVLPSGEDFLVVYYGSDAAGGWQSLDRPLRTMTTLDRFGLVEYSSEGLTLRMLQPTELKRAMGLDEAFLLEKGSRRDKVRVLGNGVCAPVMQRIVETLAGAELAASPELGGKGKRGAVSATKVAGSGEALAV